MYYYNKIRRKILLFKYIFLFLKYICFSSLILLIFLLLKTIFINKINKYYTDSININTELVYKPIIQLNDKNNNLTVITSTDGVINNNFDRIKLYNVNIKNDFFEAHSKEVLYKNEEIIFKYRPNILFYNNND